MNNPILPQWLRDTSNEVSPETKQAIIEAMEELDSIYADYPSKVQIPEKKESE